MSLTILSAESPSGVRTRLPSSLARLCSNSWPPVVSLLSSLALAAGFYSDSLSPADDPMMQPFVPAGEVHFFGMSPPASPPQLTSASGEVVLHLKGFVRGNARPTAPESTNVSYSVVHGVEMIVHCHFEMASDSTFVDRYEFERVWEASLLTRHSVFEPEGAPPQHPLFESSPYAGQYVGQRRHHPRVVAQLISGVRFPVEEIGADNQALWSISSLSGKSIRIQSRTDGKIISIQPLGSGLTKNERDWLRRTILPRLVHALPPTNQAGGPAFELAKLEHVLPYDVAFAKNLHGASSGKQSLQLQDNNWSLSWKEPPQFFRELYPANVFLNRGLKPAPPLASLVCVLSHSAP